MRNNRNILVGGAAADVFIKENKNDNQIIDNIYFKTGDVKNPPLLIIRLIPIIPDNNDNKSLLFSVAKPDEEMMEKIHKVNPTYKWDGSKQEEIKEWTLIFHEDYNTQDAAYKSKIYNGKMSKLFFKGDKFYRLAKNSDFDKVKKYLKKDSKGANDDNNDNEMIDKLKKDTTKKTTNKSTKKITNKSTKKTTRKKYCKKGLRGCKLTDKEEEDDIENCEKQIQEDGSVKCLKKQIKKEKIQKKKTKKKPHKTCKDLLIEMKEYLKDGTDFINKHNKDYNNYLKCVEEKNSAEIKEDENDLYPLMEDKNFNKKIYQKKEFREGNEYPERSEDEIENIEETTNSICNNFEFELLPHQKFIRNFLSFQTPYNSLLIYHGLGTGKTCSSIGVAEEYRTYANQMGINKKIIIVASKYVQENYKKQLFDENKLKNVGGLWNIKSCTGNKFIKEINPMNMVGLSREHVIKQIKIIIRQNYEFMAYREFARKIEKNMKKSSLNNKESEESRKAKIQAVKDEYSDRLIIIDEVHNIRDTEIEEKSKDKSKSTTEYFKTLVTYADNLKLLLLTGTPMYNEYSEIIWLLNLMNLNDNRYSIEEEDIFDNKGNITDEGREILIQKARGYVSFVQGEDPFLFPFRVYPKEDEMSYGNNSLTLLTKKSIKENQIYYPEKQLNNYIIPTIDGKRGIKYLDIYLTNMGSEQQAIYEEYINYMINEEKVGSVGEGFSYTLLLIPSQMLNICYPTNERDWDKKYGSNGLKEIMDYNHKSLNEFEYKKGNEGFFKEDKLKQYSGKITNIIKEIKKSKGIILVYSQYIEGGCIPVALALEEAGYSKYGGSLFKNKEDVENKGSYVMITGKRELSNRMMDMINICNSDENKNGEKIKVVIISRAGSEGLDFANIRQVHIMDAWYNLNRTGQIEGRAIRNQSHCRLDFKDRNVLIFLHGTKGLNDDKEAADLYMYRMAEKKSELSGKVSRILKETAIDCLLNENQKKLSQDKLNLKRKILLSNGENNEIDFNIGHSENSQICDFMNCDYKCIPNIGNDWKENTTTYNESFMKLTVSKIMEIIRRLFKERYVYNKRELIESINIRRKYKTDEIYSALSILISDKTEYIEDNLKRKGRLINIGDLYLFQPVEIDDDQLTMYQRKHPMPFKPKEIEFKIKNIEEEEIDTNTVISDLFERIDYCYKKNKFKDKYQEWLTDKSKQDINFMKKYEYLFANASHYLNKHLNIDLDELKKLMIFKLLDGVEDNYKTKLYLLNNKEKDELYKDYQEEYKENLKSIINEYFDRYKFSNNYYILSHFKREYLDKFSKGAVTVVVKEGNIYKKVDEEIETLYINKYIDKIKKLNLRELDELMGFTTIVDEKRKDDIVFKYKSIEGKKVNKGVRCDNNPLNKIVLPRFNTLLKIITNNNEDKEKILENIRIQTHFEIIDDNKSKYTKISPNHICLMIELLLRYFHENNINDKKWFFMCVEAIIYGIPELPKIKTTYQELSINKID